MALRELLSSTSLSGKTDAKLLEALGVSAQEKKEPLTLDALAALLKDHVADAEKLKKASKQNSPVYQQAFLDYLRETDEAATALKAQLQKLRDDAKKEQGYLQKAFSVFSHPKPLEKVIRDVASFDKYCRQNGITFDEVNHTLVAGEKPKTVMGRIWDFRFLVAAAGGGALGLAGVNLAGSLPALGMITGAFFTGLPYLALPFITLSIFRAFSEKSLTQEAGTLGRFAAVMTGGFLISLGVTAAMSGFLPHIDPATVGHAAGFITKAGKAAFSPSQYILHGIAAGAVFGNLYRLAKNKVKTGVASAAETGKNKLSKAFNRASNIIVNKYTAPVINAAGKVADKLAGGIDKAFGHYMNFIGVPAVAILMSGALATGGFAALAAYGGYYATVFTGMAIAGIGLASAAFFRYKLRGKEFGSLAKVAGTALGTSSSAATMPVTKASLKEIGVPDRITNSVVPLGANFNMLGTSLYLGATAAAALVMFGAAPTLPILALVGVTTVLTAFGAPGMPSSNIILLDPVLQKTGLSPAQSAKIYEMVLPFDRILDMCQTSLNVLGDCLVALEVWRSEKKAAAAPKQEGQRWGDRLVGKLRTRLQPEKAPANDNKAAAAPQPQEKPQKKPQEKPPAVNDNKAEPAAAPAPKKPAAPRL